MERQDKPKSKKKGLKTREAGDIPPDEQAKHAGDDYEAETREVEIATSRAVRPWRVAQSLLTLREQVNRQAPGRSKAGDGTIGDAAHATRASDHNPWVIDGRNGVVTAMDITHDVSGGCDANALAEAIRGSQDGRVKYIIWNRRIASSAPINGQPAWAWRPYSGRNPHNHHVHISVKSDKANYDSTASWTIDDGV